VARRGLFSSRGKVLKIVRDPPNLSIDRNEIALTFLEQLMKANKAKDTPLSMDFERTLQAIDLGKKFPGTFAKR
jgi:hypothetical protein